MKYRVYKSRNWLQAKYVVEECSMGELASQAQCSISTIRNWLKTYRIPIKEVGRPGVGRSPYYTIGAAVSKEEFDTVQTRAKALGISVSQLIRNKVLVETHGRKDA